LSAIAADCADVDDDTVFAVDLGLNAGLKLIAIFYPY
jgi:hypothetical protein